MIHYHGTPITPIILLQELAGRSFCVSWRHPYQVRQVHEVGESVMLDNGAFSHWKQGEPAPDWSLYYRWLEPWLIYANTWSVIPDVIMGTEEQNDELLSRWPHGHKGAPVWHLHESLERLRRLVANWPRVCFGSSADFSQVGSQRWHGRMIEAFNTICPNGGPPPAHIHMLRGMQCSDWSYPFASVDSTDIAVNHCHIKTHLNQARYWGSKHCPPTWTLRAVQLNLLEVG